MIPNKLITDADRGEFLKKLDNSDLNPTEWEISFIESFLSHPSPSFFWTNGRRVSCDRMRMVYGSESEIKMPMPITEKIAINSEKADDGCCQYTIYDQLKNKRTYCNQPAVMRRKNGFRFCMEHANLASTELKRFGRTMHLYPI